MVECMWLFYRVRAAKCLVAIPHDEGVLIYNFLTQRATICSKEIFGWISYLREWKSVGDVLSQWTADEADHIESQLRAMTKSTLLMLEGSKEQLLEQEYLNHWEWGPAAGFLHFSLMNNSFLTPDEGRLKQLERAKVDPSPSLCVTHGHGALNLPSPGNSSIAEVLKLMRNRRTNRVRGERSISLMALADCLYAGMAVTGVVKTETGFLPLQMTPSGGARNTFEAFVIVHDVKDLPRGVYHYSATQHSLASVSGEVPENIGDLLAGQEWANEKPATIILVGFFERLMWKYQDSNSYRVALIEAGHKGQNIALSATAHELSACPTAALHHETVARYLKLDSITHSPIYAMTLSKPGAYDFDIMPVTPPPICEQPDSISNSGTSLSLRSTSSQMAR